MSDCATMLISASSVTFSIERLFYFVKTNAPPRGTFEGNRGGARLGVASDLAVGVDEEHGV